MGKVLKIVAVIAIAAAVAYFAPQISAAILAGTAASAATTAAVTAAVATALTAAASLAMTVLASKPRSDVTPSIYRQSLGNSWIVYGKRRVGGLMVFFHPLYAGKFHYRFFVIAVAGHRCKGVTRWFLNDEEVAVGSDGLVLSGKYKGDAWLWFGRGTDAQEAPYTFLADTGGKWTYEHCGKGVAKIFAKFRMTDDVIAAGMPNITAEIEGKDDIADPRTGAVGYVRNAALVFYDWLRLPREEGGFGAYDDEIDDDWVSAQANVCDEQVPLKAGGTEPRYVFDSYLQTGSPPSEVRDTFVNCCAGTFTYSGGRMLMRPGYYVPPSATLLEHDLAGPIVVPALRPSNEIVTEVAATYVDPTMYAGKDAPTRSVPTDDVRQGALDLPHVTSGTAAQRIAEITLRKAQAERRVQWPMNIVGIGVSTLDTVQLRTSRYGLDNYAFQVANWQLGQDFGVTLSLEEHSPDIFEWSPAMELAIGEAPMLTPADPIGDDNPAVDQLIIANSYPLGISIISSDDAGTAKVTISNHQRVYQDRTVVVTGATLNGLQNSTDYYLFYDDPDRAGGAVTIEATTTYGDAFTSSTYPARHYLGFVTSATTGGGDTGGGGATPPGGGGGGRNPNTVIP